MNDDGAYEKQADAERGGDADQWQADAEQQPYYSCGFEESQ